MADSIVCVSSKILNHCLNHGLLFSLFKFLGEEIFQIKLKIQIWIPILINISVLLDVQAYLPETSPFSVCPNGFGEHLFSNVYSTYLGCITLYVPCLFCQMQFSVWWRKVFGDREQKEICIFLSSFSFFAMPILVFVLLKVFRLLYAWYTFRLTHFNDCFC